jgi:hypothetical protein
MIYPEKSRKTGRWATLISLVLILAALLSGCGALPFAAPTATPIPPTATPIPPTATAVPPTATPLPTATSTPTITPIPALALVPEGMDSWCLPIDFGVYIDGPNGPDSMPAGARPGEVDKKTNVLNLHIPGVTCTVVYTFNQSMAPGTMLQIFDPVNKAPFFEEALTVSPTNPNKGYFIIKHPYVINPPFWWQDYTFVVTGPDGQELNRQAVHVFKSLPEKCWDGSLPDPVTLFCKIQDS